MEVEHCVDEVVGSGSSELLNKGVAKGSSGRDSGSDRDTDRQTDRQAGRQKTV
jgi:hypothetical protein